MKKIKGIAFIGLVFCCFNVFLSAQYHSKGKIVNVIGSDARGYYQYLPFFFIKNDIKRQDYTYHFDNGTSFNKYTYGVALLQSPFFLVAYGYDSIVKQDLSGYGNLYAYSIIIATSCYLFFGLLLTFLLLSKWFNRITAWLSVMLLYGSTNMFFYSIVEPGASHIYSFFCFSGFVYFVDRFYASPNFKNNLGAALFFAMAFLIRQTNAFIILFLLLYNVYSLKDVVTRIRFFMKEYKYAITYAICIFILFLPQMLYWKALVNEYIVFAYKYSYSEESFLYWKSPKIFEVLFGTSCSWLPYTPIMAISLASLFYLAFKKQYQAIPILLIFLLALYTCASWWAYNFSCAFGYRPFVEYYSILIIPLAYLINSILNMWGKTLLKSGFLILFLMFVFLNVSMTYEFKWEMWCGPDWNYEKYYEMLSKIMRNVS